VAETNLQCHTNPEMEIQHLERDTTRSAQDIFTLVTLLNQDLSNLTQRVHTPSGVPTSPNLALEVRDLAARLTRLEINSAASPLSHAIVPEMEMLKIQLKLIESRIPAFNVLKLLGGKIFNYNMEIKNCISQGLDNLKEQLYTEQATALEDYLKPSLWHLTCSSCLKISFLTCPNGWMNFMGNSSLCQSLLKMKLGFWFHLALKECLKT
jgi:hypothetical protein